MRLVIYKSILLFMLIIVVQGCVLPWIISNDVLPMWACICLLSGLVFLWVFVIDKLVSNAIRKFENDTDKNTPN